MDDDVLGRRIERHRRELRAHCYRMLGSAPEAEDATQEAMLKAWQGRDGVREPEHVRAWLYRIATNVCLDALRKRGPRILAHQAFPPSELGTTPRPFLESSVWIGPFVDAPGPDEEHARAEHVALAFVAALQHLPAKQRAAVLLRDVVELSADEAAGALETTRASVESALQRARATLRARVAADAGIADARDASPALLERYVATWRSGDAEAFVALLAEDASFVMPPTPVWFEGREAVGAFVAARLREATWHLEPLVANARPAFALYRGLEGGGWARHGIQVLDVVDGAVRRIQTFLALGDDRTFRTFGLPERLDENRRPVAA